MMTVIRLHRSGFPESLLATRAACASAGLTLVMMRAGV